MIITPGNGGSEAFRECDRIVSGINLKAREHFFTAKSPGVQSFGKAKSETLASSASWRLKLLAVQPTR
jgi:hypothetical protein